MNSITELTHAVLTSFLKDEFYESGDARAKRIATLVDQVATKEPKFVAQLAKVARSEYHLRSVTTVLLGALSKVHRGDDLVKRAIIASTERVDDLMELAAYVGKPIPKQVKRGIRNALFKFNRYQLAKYRGEGKDISLVDLFNLVHPKVQHASADQKKAWEDLMTGNIKSVETWESKISAAGQAEEGDKEELKKEAWEDLVLSGKMGYMALLRNLNNLISSGVKEEVIDAAVKKLTNPEEVKKSKQLPFRFYTASQIVTGNRKLADAISDAMDLSVANVPKFEGKMLIAVDTSGSMRGDALQKASVFAAAMIKANDADVILYDTQIKELAVSSRSTILDLANKIMNGALGGGTQTSLVFAFAAASKTNYDRVVILSDNESWAEGYNNSVQQVYEAYKKSKSADPYVFAIDIQGYGTTDIQKSSKVFHLTGWSERLLDFIGAAEQGDTLIEHIRSIEI